MKKIFTLLWLTLTAFTFNASVQTTVCNAEFSVQYITNANVKFNPVITAGAPTYQHIWNFGDGSPVSNVVSPTHTYTLPGTYTTVQTIIKYDSNNVPECTQSFSRTIVIAPDCNLVVDFSWTQAPTNPFTIAFHNLSVPLSTTDSIIWQFGDGTTSHDVNPTHIYTNAGTYNVCLIVKKNNNSTPFPCIKYICKTVVIQTACNLQPYFSSIVSAANPLTVQFNNLSTPSEASDSIRWTFGDGASVSGLQSDPNVANPVHSYANAGNYTVCIRVKKNNNTTSTPCVREFCNTIVIPLLCNLAVDFSWTATATNPLQIEFHNLTTSIATNDSIRWTLGDGSASSQINPVHTYNAPGTYTVCLRIIRYNTGGTTPCIREICKTIVVTQPCNLVINFSSQPDPTHQLGVKFTNLSNLLNTSDSVRWTFGDGTSTSGLQGDPNVANPTHIYANAGTFNVCLRVKKNTNPTATNICVRELCRTIVVTSACNFQAAFIWHLDSINHKKVYFTNQTAAPTAIATATWSFGDGTSATGWNTVHEFAQPGTYRVCLRVVATPNCVSETCDTVIIPNAPPACTQLSKFHFEKFSNDNQQYKFTPDYLNTTLQYTWTFGDGTGSHDPIAIHRYTQPGVYTACLTVWRGPDCASTTCHEISVQPQINCDSIQVTYNYQRDSQVPNKISFYAVSSLPILDQVWTITRLPVSTPNTQVVLHQSNPVYLFQDTGLYRVCLRAITLGGCVKEFCREIRIGQVASGCMLQACPNPTSNTINVNVQLSQPELIYAFIYNSMNMLIRDKQQQGHTGSNIVSFTVNDLAAGQYTIKLVYGNNICYARFTKL